MSARGAQETAAHQYADAGWPAFPCRAGSKEPATEHGFRDATTDHRQIERWWSAAPDRNVGIATGAPGPDVVDVDNHGDRGNGFAALNMLKREGLVDGYQAVVQTPSRGIHLYYAGTGQRNGSIRGQHLDFRSTGGYVVAPPSQTGRGAYVVAKHETPTGARVSWDAIRRTLEPPAQPQRAAQAAPYPQGDPGKSMDRLANWVARRGDGDRNFPLFWAAKQAELIGALDGASVERLVDAFARADPGVNREAEARRTIESGRQAARRESAPQAIRPQHGSHQAAMRPFADTPQRQLQAGG